VNRRRLISLVGGAVVAWPHILLAQATAKRPLIGWLGTATQETAVHSINAFLRGMQELAYVEGRDFDMTYRFAHGDWTRYPALAKELVTLKPKVILAISAGAAKSATDTIPIVSATLPADVVRAGLAASVPHPGSNVTGIFYSIDGLPAKHVELVRELMPGATKLGILNNVVEPQNIPSWQDMQSAARTLNFEIVPAEVRLPGDLDAAFQAMRRQQVEAIVVIQDGMLFSERRRIAALAEVARIPAVYGHREHVEDGGLISYGIDLRDSHRRLAAYVVKILSGTKPGEIPIQFPTKLELVINLKTAKALGLDVPATLLARADEVIE
jgi:putative ABC transport system substrate-binding protein